MGECDFDKNNVVSQAELYLEKILGDNCDDNGSHTRVEEIVMALKAIGNARRPLRIRGTLLKCADNDNANITHSAVHALKKMPCNDELFNDETNSFIMNGNINPGKRIHVFDAALSCPNEYLLERLVVALDKEQSKQLASYMWSKLSNIMESNNP